MIAGLLMFEYIVTLAWAGIMKDSVVGIEKGDFKSIRLKSHYVQDETEIARLAGSARRMRIMKKAIELGLDIVQDTVEVERLKQPLLFPRPCNKDPFLSPHDQKVYLRKNSHGKYKQFCERSCKISNITCSYMRDIVLPDSHLDDCYICNSSNPNQRSFDGFKNTDAVIYVKVLSSIHTNKDWVIAEGGTCVLEPTARDRPTALLLILATNIFKSYITIETLYGYHLYIATMVHEIVHGLGLSLDAQPYQRYSNGRPQTRRYNDFPYRPVEYSSTKRLIYAHDFYWTEFYYKANGSLFENYNNTVWYKGKNYIKAARSFFGCDSLDGGPLDSYGTHLDLNRVVGGPMSKVADEEMNPPGKLSSLTAAYLEDTGWYKIKKSHIREPIGGTYKRRCKLAKFGCVKYKSRPCCSLSYPNDTDVFCARPSLIGKVLCLEDRRIQATMPMMRLWHFQEYKEIWNSMMPYCRYASWETKNNILWEMSDLKKGFCFEPFDRSEHTLLDLSRIGVNQTSVVNTTSLRFFSGCYKVNCVNETTYTVQAEFGASQVCRSMGDKIMFKDGDKKVGPFKCWNIGLVCKKEEADDFRYAPSTVPS